MLAELINLEYFSLNITNLPIIEGAQTTPESYIDYIRKKFKIFEGESTGDFFFQGCDEDRWNSNNLLGSLFTIDIDVWSNFGDDGSVTCSSYEQGYCWVFTTVRDSNFMNSTSDGCHPVSGNRQFWLIENQDGTYTFYTWGADRPTTWWDNLNHYAIYGGGAELWTKLMNHVRNFVGITYATVPTFIIHRSY